MVEDIERLCSWISLTNEEKKGISISEGDTAELKGKANKCWWVDYGQIKTPTMRCSRMCYKKYGEWHDELFSRNFKIICGCSNLRRSRTNDGSLLGGHGLSIVKFL